MKRGLILVLYIFTNFWSSSLLSAAIPDAFLEVAVRQKTDGEISRAYHVLQLQCTSGECELTSLTLNQCMTAGSGKDAFYPKIERSSTTNGSLKVTSNRINELEAREHGPEAETVYRFGFEKIKGEAIARRLTKFSGGYVKNSSALDRVLTVEYLPLQGSLSEVEIDCGALLPGLYRSSKE